MLRLQENNISFFDYMKEVVSRGQLFFGLKTKLTPRSLAFFEGNFLYQLGLYIRLVKLNVRTARSFGYKNKHEMLEHSALPKVCCLLGIQIKRI